LNIPRVHPLAVSIHSLRINEEINASVLKNKNDRRKNSSFLGFSHLNNRRSILFIYTPVQNAATIANHM
jgi:hypothetical protein